MTPMKASKHGTTSGGRTPTRTKRGWAPSPEQLGSALMQPGTVVAMSRRTAESCGAVGDDCISAEEAAEAVPGPSSRDQPRTG